MAMKNPPRRTTIRGQKHLLAYITPEEAQLLMDNGGSGEPGPMGIPSFPPGFGSERSGFGAERAGGAAGGKSGAAGPSGKDGDGPDKNMGKVDPGLAKAAADKAAEMAAAQAVGQSPGAMGGYIGSAHQTAPSSGRGFDVNLAKAMSRIAAAPASQRLGFTDRQIMKAYQTGKAPGIAGFFGMPLGRTQNYLTFNDPNRGIFSSFDSQAPSFGMPGFISELFDLDPYVTTGFNQDGTIGDGMGREGDGRETVAAEYNPNTGRQDQCPEGYVFDEDLQACRMGGGTPGFGTPVTGAGPYEAGDYARMGLLDVAPMGMGMFADRYGAGFGTPQDFSAANLAFRRGAATRPQYFQQAPDLTGYTLLA